MGYVAFVGKTSPVNHLDGTPVLVSELVGTALPIGPGLAATIEDDGAGNLVCVGNTVSADGLPFILNGVEHVVTVAFPPFDWELGGPA